MKAKEIKALTDQQLVKTLREKQQALLELSMKAKANQLKQLHQVKETRKVIARLLTQQKERLSIKK